MTGIAVPRPIDRMLTLSGLDALVRLALASPFLISGVAKLLDFGGAVDEVTGLGLQPTTPVAAAIMGGLALAALFVRGRSGRS
jgi:uncharacterized membrane protein YphA (DoxX/SURF4 family)